MKPALTEAQRAVLIQLAKGGAHHIDDPQLAHSLDVEGLIKPMPGPSTRYALTTDGADLVRYGVIS